MNILVAPVDQNIQKVIDQFEVFKTQEEKVKLTLFGEDLEAVVYSTPSPGSNQKIKTLSLVKVLQNQIYLVESMCSDVSYRRNQERFISLIKSMKLRARIPKKESMIIVKDEKSDLAIFVPENWEMQEANGNILVHAKDPVVDRELKFTHNDYEGDVNEYFQMVLKKKLQQMNIQEVQKKEQSGSNSQSISVQWISNNKIFSQYLIQFFDIPSKIYSVLSSTVSGGNNSELLFEAIESMLAKYNRTSNIPFPLNYKAIVHLEDRICFPYDKDVLVLKIIDPQAVQFNILNGDPNFPVYQYRSISCEIEEDLIKKHFDNYAATLRSFSSNFEIVTRNDSETFQGYPSGTLITSSLTPVPKAESSEPVPTKTHNLMVVILLPKKLAVMHYVCLSSTWMKDMKTLQENLKNMFFF